MKITNTHVYFWNGPFSNWSTAHFKAPSWNDSKILLDFENSEQCFMYYKAMFFGDVEIAEKILKNSDPKYVKGLGRKIKNYDEEKWKIVRFNLMVAANVPKYLQNESLKKVLMETEERVLVEASPYDCVWGVGLEETDPRILDEKNWKGSNLLGYALLHVRGLLSTNVVPFIRIDVIHPEFKLKHSDISEPFYIGYGDGYNDLGFNNPFCIDSDEFFEYVKGFEDGANDC